MGLRIIERVREEYGGDDDAHVTEEMNPFTNPSNAKKALQANCKMDSTPSRGPFSYTDVQDNGGGFLGDDDCLDGRGFFPEGHDEIEVQLRAGELTIENGRSSIDDGRPNGHTPINPEIGNRGLPDPDNREEALIEAELDDKASVLRKAPKNRKKAATSISGSQRKISTNLPKRRAAPRRKAVRKSETAVSSRLIEHGSDEDDSGDRGDFKSREVALKKTAKKNGKKEGSGPLL